MRRHIKNVLAAILVTLLTVGASGCLMELDEEMDSTQQNETVAESALGVQSQSANPDQWRDDEVKEERVESDVVAVPREEYDEDEYKEEVVRFVAAEEYCGFNDCGAVPEDLEAPDCDGLLMLDCQLVDDYTCGWRYNCYQSYN